MATPWAPELAASADDLRRPPGAGAVDLAATRLANSARIKALGLAPASLLAPFGYTQIPTATLVGLLVFGDLPDTLSWAGIGDIVGSGLYVWQRERRKERQA